MDMATSTKATRSPQHLRAGQPRQVKATKKAQTVPATQALTHAGETKTIENSLHRLQKLRTTLNNLFVGREGEVDAVLAGLLSGEPVILVGAPGTAKSAIITSLGRLVGDTRVFNYLMTRFTEPDELFGPLDITAYKKGIVRRITDNTVLDADLVFLDEIFKSSGAIRNTLLQVMNEKVYHYGNQSVKVPWMGLFTASNEISHDEEDQAFYDRLVIRRFVEPVLAKKPHQLLIASHRFKKLQENLRPIISKSDIQELRQKVAELVEHTYTTNPKLVETLAQALVKINEELPTPVSDRRAGKVLPVAAALALLEGHTMIHPAHVGKALLLIAPNDPSDLDIVRRVVEETGLNKMLEDPNELARRLVSNVRALEPSLEEYQSMLKEVDKALGSGDAEVVESTVERLVKTLDIDNNLLEEVKKGAGSVLKAKNLDPVVAEELEKAIGDTLARITVLSKNTAQLSRRIYEDGIEALEPNELLESENVKLIPVLIKLAEAQGRLLSLTNTLADIRLRTGLDGSEDIRSLANSIAQPLSSAIVSHGSAVMAYNAYKDVVDQASRDGESLARLAQADEIIRRLRAVKEILVDLPDSKTVYGKQTSQAFNLLAKLASLAEKSGDRELWHRISDATHKLMEKMSDINQMVK